MRTQLLVVSILFASFVFATSVSAAEEDVPSVTVIREAVAKSIPLLERGSRGSIEQRKQCFNCHNQGLPVMALTEARSRGFSVDSENLVQQVEFTANFLKKNQDRYRKGAGQGGGIDTAGYALWTLDVAKWPSDETTFAVTDYLLQHQSDQDHWQPQSVRPPGERSYFTSTYVALRGLKAYATSDQQERVNARLAKVREWLATTRPEDTEDHVFRVRIYSLQNFEKEDRDRAATELLAIQREDGGWSQTAEMSSDAYATGSALVTLLQAGSFSSDDPRYRRGLSYLISQQKDDGSWHVVSRAEPFQSYFESGYPHGKDQFISIAAASWATMALTQALPPQPVEAKVRQPE